MRGCKVIEHNVEVLIIGAGPAGLSAAIELAGNGIKNILIVDREKQAGGVPRLCRHSGFGLRDIHRVMSGPAYAKRYIRTAERLGVDIALESIVTGWDGPNAVTVTTPEGLKRISAKAILLATGCIERPRSARLVPGARPAGVFTTGSLQDFLHSYNLAVGSKAVIVGAELVSFSALHTLKKHNVCPVAMTTEHQSEQLYFPFTPLVLFAKGFGQKPLLLPDSHLRRIVGRERVTAVEVITSAGETRTIPCDTVVFTGNWVPEYELARLGGLEMNPHTKGPLVDQNYRTSVKGVFAAGNLLRGAEPADVAALEGRGCARSIKGYLDNGNWPERVVPLQTKGPLSWMVPSCLSTGESKQGRHFMFRVNKFLTNHTLSIIQDGQVLFRKEFKKLGPNHSYRITSDWTKKVKNAGNLIVTLSS